MRQPPSLNDVDASFIVDASVIINLNASGYAPEIIRSHRAILLASDIVKSELGFDRKSGRDDGEMANGLVEQGLLKYLPFDDEAEKLFESLVSGEAGQTLDDGEAATLAIAATTNIIAVVDEQKAIRISTERFPGLTLVSTADLLLAMSVKTTIGRDLMADAVFNALVRARMSVPDRHYSSLVELLGDRLHECRSVPAGVRRLLNL